MDQAGYVVAQGRIVLFKTDPDRYSPSLINKVNEDGTVNLTVFKPGGDTGLEESVKQGSQIGEWCPPGVDAGKVPPKPQLNTGSVQPVGKAPYVSKKEA